MKESTTYVTPLTQWAPITIITISVIIIVAAIVFGTKIYRRTKKN
jgi:hypothetical protein